ncbi:MAG TPA: cytochrome c3 family protein [Pyrinomonadaceae bacterium]|nr:cytochrome c3 family protein [Pyrinomonadaceae bacterium]
MKLRLLWSTAAVFFILAFAGSSVQTQRRRSPPPRRLVDYSKFSHNMHVNAQKIACDGCHKFPTKNWKEVRKGDAAFPDVAEFPEHSTCLNCHREQFFARERPAPAICSNCHLQATPKDQTRHRFPSLGGVETAFASQFSVFFPHNKHEEVMGSDAKSCATCHQTDRPQGKSDDEYLTKPPADLGERFWLKKGTFKTLPSTHAECFACHSTESELAPLPSNCNACHKLGIPVAEFTDADPAAAATMKLSGAMFLRAWTKRDSAATFRHEIHSDLECTKCHTIAKLNTLNPTAVKVPVQSCGGAEGCHITTTADDGGILNYELDQRKAKPGFQCTKCHIRFGTQAVPLSHAPRSIL